MKIEEVKTETINLELNHFVESDFKCEFSKLLITKTINNKREYIEITGIDAEALFNLVSDFIKPKEDKNETTRNTKE